jgi:Ca2+-binding RTX toxin-like protein
VTQDFSRRSDTDEKADTAMGGLGNDTLSGDDGDTLTGGEGADLFALDYLDRVPNGTETIRWAFDATVITDFTPQDRIEIEIEGAPDDVTIDLVASGADTILRFGPHDVAVLKGVAPSAVGNGQIVVLP